MKMKLDEVVSMARTVAYSSNMRHHLGAVLYDQKRYTFGYNRCYDVEVVGYGNPFSVHAEEMAILKGVRIGIDFPNSTLVVVRVNSGGNLRMSKPCATCQKLIEKVGIKRIWYVG